MNVETLNALPPRQSADVMSLSVRATTHDGVKPLSEQTVLDARRLPAEGAAATHTSHLLIFDNPGEINARVIGYGHIEHPGDGEPATFELVIHPEHRGQGLGHGLLGQILSTWPGARGWAHGNLEAAQSLAQGRDLRPVRELWQMSRPVDREDADSLPQVDLPEDFALRSFEVGRDEEAWLAVNARAFADHGEQGRTTLQDLQDRMSETWFDPHGFLLIEDVSDPDHPRLAGFHWTKVEPAEPGSSRSTAGEVYVVGVDPAYQGRGLGRVSTVVGLRHLQACGLSEVRLYVDGDNAAAVATYRKLGFERIGIDVMYSAEPLP
ncbi:MAG: mycothiol synthase [Ornithinimicrobium sp.]